MLSTLVEEPLRRKHVYHFAYRWTNNAAPCCRDHYCIAGWDVTCFLAPREHFSKVVVSVSMMSDHWPWRIQHALEAAMVGPVVSGPVCAAEAV